MLNGMHSGRREGGRRRAGEAHVLKQTRGGGKLGKIALNLDGRMLVPKEILALEQLGGSNASVGALEHRSDGLVLELYGHYVVTYQSKNERRFTRRQIWGKVCEFERISGRATGRLQWLAQIQGLQCCGSKGWCHEIWRHHRHGTNRSERVH